MDPIAAFDGIIRNLTCAKHNRFDIGFVEVKPPREPYPKDSTEDRNKILSALKCSLRHICTKLPTMKDVVLIGILCNGMP